MKRSEVNWLKKNIFQQGPNLWKPFSVSYYITNEKTRQALSKNVPYWACHCSEEGEIYQAIKR